MAAKVYTIHITYEGLEEKIWRKVEVSSNYRLNQLGYMVLAAFDTMAYHLFGFCYDDGQFEIPNEDMPFDRIDVADHKLHQLKLKLGDRIRMDYDFGTTQTFWLELIGIADMKRGWGRRYPYILDGAGRGIIDGMSCEDLMELEAKSNGLRKGMRISGRIDLQKRILLYENTHIWGLLKKTSSRYLQ